MPRRSTPPIVALWPLWALLLLAAHVALLAFLHVRPGRMAIVPFVVGPVLLFGLTVVTVTFAVFDLLYGGWRRLLRGRIVFDVLVLSACVFIALLAYRAYPSSYDGRPATACLALPLEGDIAIMQGGRTVDANYHAGSPAQRYAYDVAIARDGSTHRGDGYVIWDYHAYGQPVLAPMTGIVVATSDGDPDQSPSTDAWLAWRSAGGNHIVLEVDDGQYLFLAHLQPGSVRVQPGDRVTVGTPIGRVGNSGRSGAPHLHLHLQDTPVANRGESIPIDFCGYEVVDWGQSWDAAKRVDRGMPTGRGRRQVIRAADRQE